MSQNSNKSVISNFLWRFFERFTAQGVTIVVYIILSRLISPEQSGTIALITVFITILNVFIDSGLGSALIQKKNADNIDFSTVFFFNIFMCVVIYGLLFLCAPLIADFYHDAEYTPLIRVLGLTLVVSGVKNIQQAYVSKNMMFKKFFFATLAGTVTSAVVGIYMAYNDFGVWALVAQHLTNTVIDTALLWITVKFRPSFVFSLKRLKRLLSFGSKLLFSSLIDAFYNNIRQLIIGRMYSTSDLAFYNKGKQMPSVVVTNINNSIDSVLLPVISKNQDNVKKVKSMTRTAIKTSSYCMWPLMFGFMAVVLPFVRYVLTPKWLPCVFYLRIFCFTYGLYPIHTANLNAIKALGRSDIYLKLEIIKKVFGFSVLIATMWFGTKVMALSLLFTAIISTFLNAYPNKKLLNYSYFEQIKDIFPSFIMALIMGVCVYFITWLNLHDLLTIIIQLVLGIIIYITLSILTKTDSFYLIKNQLCSLLFKRKEENK